MALKKTQRSLRAWTRQKWRTKSGKPSTQGPKATGERYLPEKAIKALSASEYAASSAAKRKAIRRGKQVSKQPKKIAAKTRSYRSYSQDRRMSIPKKKIAGASKIVKKQKTMLVAANEDTGFKKYMSDILTPKEFDDFIKDPQRKHLVIDSYKQYLKTIEPEDDGIPF